jgi:hypothetical protein
MCWLWELPDEQTTPYIEIGPTGRKVFFTNEPAFLTGGRYCVPKRWIDKKDGIGYALCWELKPVWRGDRWNWQAVTSPAYEVPFTELLKPFPELKSDMADNSGLYRTAPAPIYQANGA